MPLSRRFLPLRLGLQIWAAAIASVAPGQGRPDWTWRLPLHQGTVFSVAPSPDGRFLATGTLLGAILIWDIETRSVVRTLFGQQQEATALAWSSNGTFLASGSQDSILQVWNAADWTLRYRVVNNGSITSVAFSPDCTLLAVAGQDTLIRDASTGAVLRTLPPGSRSQFSPDGTRFAIAGSSLHFYDTATWVRLRLVTPGGGYLAFTSDGDLLLTVGYDPTTATTFAMGYNGRTCATLWSTNGITGNIRSMALSSMARTLYLAFFSGEIKSYNANSGQFLSILLDKPYSILALAISADQGSLIGTQLDSVEAWDADTGAASWLLDGRHGFGGAVAVSPDGQDLIINDAEELLQYDVPSETFTRRLIGHTNFVQAISYSPDGTLIASAGSDRTVRIWNAANGSILRVISGLAETQHDLAFSPDGSRIAVASTNSRVYMFDVATGTLVREFLVPNGWVQGVAFSADGSRLLAAYSRWIRVFETATGTFIHDLAGHVSDVQCLAVSPNGEYVVAGSNDGRVGIWNAVTGSNVQMFFAQADGVRKIAFIADGDRIIVAGYDQVISLWSLLPAQRLAELNDEIRKVDSLKVIPGTSTYAISAVAPGLARFGMETVLPVAYRIKRGRLDSGGLSGLRYHDDIPMPVCKFIVPNLIVDPVEVEVDGVVSTQSIQSLSARVRARSSATGNFRISVELRDFETSTWTNLSESALTTTYQNTTAVGSGDLNRFIGAGGLVTVRYRVRQTGPSSTVIWCVAADVVQWSIN